MKYIFGTAIVISIFLLPLQNLQAGDAKEKEPSLIAEGLTAYKANGPEAAIKVWIKGSAMEKKAEESLAYAKNFKQLGEFYGKYLDYQLIEVKEITETSRVVIISMNYELGPVYAKFLTYKAKTGWILVSFDFNTKPEIILPALFIK